MTEADANQVQVATLATVPLAWWLTDAIDRHLSGTLVLEEASGFDDDTFLRSLDELWRRGIIRPHGAGAYDFSHGKIRDAAYEALGPFRAQHHHLRIAQSLERIEPAILPGLRIASLRKNWRIAPLGTIVALRNYRDGWRHRRGDSRRPARAAVALVIRNDGPAFAAWAPIWTIYHHATFLG